MAGDTRFSDVGQKIRGSTSASRRGTTRAEALRIRVLRMASVTNF